MGLTTQTYDILTRIAIGNGSLVYRAVEKTSLRQVALKLLAQDGDVDHRSDIPALLAAAPQLKLIAGSHVCQLLDAYEDDDGPVLVYEFVNGLNGAEFPLQRKFDAAQALDVSAQLISALRSGERQRLPHGDLKPSNLVCVDMPDGRPFVMVLDWGLAAFRNGEMMDSFPYLAPERLAGGPASHQADLFSAGAVLFYLFTGKVLAMGADRQDLMRGWASARPEILAELRPDLSPKLVHWVCGLLALDPQKRPASAVEAATALAALNPPPPMVAPESIRPRPASQRSQAGAPVSGVTPPASGVTARPAASAVRAAPSGVRAVPSGVRSAPSAAGVPVPNATLPPKPAAAQPANKKSNVALLAFLVTAAVGVAGGGAWWFTRDRAEPPRPVPGATSSRPPTTSVTAPVSKPEPRALPDKVLAGASKAKTKPTAPKPKSETARPADNPPVKVAATMNPALPYGGTKLPLGEIFIATESFAYPEGTELDGQSTGTGWAAAWKGAGAAIQKGSLEFPLHPAEGGCLRISAEKEDIQWERPVGPLKQFFREPAKGGHWYFTALIQQSENTPGAGGELRLIPFDSAEGKAPIQIVIRNAGKGLKIAMPGGNAPVDLPDASRPVFVLCRIGFANPKDGKWDITALLLVNPKIESASFAGGGKPIAASAPGVALPNDLVMQIRKARGNSTTLIDEIRYGRHWEEMTFKAPQIDEPAPRAAAR